MFSLAYGFLKWWFSKTEVQILILGLDHAGKTTLLEQMKGVFLKTKGIPLDKIPPTVGLNIGRMDVLSCRVIFWDLGGQATLRSIWDKYYAEAHGLLFVIDSSDQARFAEAKAAMDSLMSHPELAGVPLLVFANKQDIPSAASYEDIEAVFKVSEFANSGSYKRKQKLVAVSALTCAGVEDGVKWLVDCISSDEQILLTRTRPR